MTVGPLKAQGFNSLDMRFCTSYLAGLTPSGVIRSSVHQAQRKLIYFPDPPIA
jgi:hypothetical protein